MEDQNEGDDPKENTDNFKYKWWSSAVDYGKRKLYEYRSNKKDEKPQDRVARHVMWATWTIALFTFATVAVGVFTYFAVNGQLRVMQAQLNEMRASGTQTDKLIAANNITAEAAKEAIALSEKTSERQLRAYLGVDNGYLDRKQAICILPIRNFGQTPAYEVRVYTRRLMPTEEAIPVAHDFGIIMPGAQPDAMLLVEDLDFSGILRPEAADFRISVEIHYQDASRYGTAKFLRMEAIYYSHRKSARDDGTIRLYVMPNTAKETEYTK